MGDNMPEKDREMPLLQSVKNDDVTDSTLSESSSEESESDNDWDDEFALTTLGAREAPEEVHGNIKLLPMSEQSKTEEEKNCTERVEIPESQSDGGLGENVQDGREGSVPSTYYTCSEWGDEEGNARREETAPREEVTGVDAQLLADLNLESGPREECVVSVDFPKKVPMKPDESWDFSLQALIPDFKVKTLLVEGSHYQGLVEKCLHEMQHVACECDEKIKIGVCRLCHVVFCSNKCYKRSINQLSGEDSRDDEPNEKLDGEGSRTAATISQSDPVHVVDKQQIGSEPIGEGDQTQFQGLPVSSENKPSTLRTPLSLVPTQVQINSQKSPTPIRTEDLWADVPEPRRGNFRVQRGNFNGARYNTSFYDDNLSRNSCLSTASVTSTESTEQQPKSFFNKRHQHTPQPIFSSGGGGGAPRGRGSSRSSFSSGRSSGYGYPPRQSPYVHHDQNYPPLGSGGRSFREPRPPMTSNCYVSPGKEDKIQPPTKDTYMGVGRGNVGRGHQQENPSSTSTSSSSSGSHVQFEGKDAFIGPRSSEVGHLSDTCSLSDSGNFRSYSSRGFSQRSDIGRLDKIRDLPLTQAPIQVAAAPLQLPVDVPVRVLFPVAYTHGSDFHDFGVMKTQQRQEFIQFFQKMQNVVNIKPMGICTPEEMCMIKYASDPTSPKRWYRGKITKDVVSTVGISLIDRGAHIVVKKEEVFVLPSEFVQQKPFALRVKCLNVAANMAEKDVLEQFNLLVKNAESKLKLKITHKDVVEEDLLGCHLVVWHPTFEKWFDAGALLKKLQIGDKSTPEEILEEERRGTIVPLFEPAKIFRILEPMKDNYTIHVETVESASEIYVQTKDSFQTCTEIERQLYKMKLNSIENLADLSQPLHMWRGRGEQRRRVQVLEIEENWEDAKCQIVDFGDIQTIPIKYLRQLPEKFIKIPAQSFICSLPLKPNPDHKSKKKRDEEFAHVKEQLEQMKESKLAYFMRVFNIEEEEAPGNIVDFLFDGHSFVDSYVEKKYAVLSHNVKPMTS